MKKLVVFSTVYAPIKFNFCLRRTESGDRGTENHSLQGVDFEYFITKICFINLFIEWKLSLTVLFITTFLFLNFPFFSNSGIFFSLFFSFFVKCSQFIYTVVFLKVVSHYSLAFISVFVLFYISRIFLSFQDPNI